MRSPFARWKVGHLVASWVGYWAVLAAVTLAPAANALWKVSRAGAKGDASLSVGDAGVHATVSVVGVTHWEHTVSLTTLVLFIAGPPLLLWVTWLLASSGRRVTAETDEVQQLASGAEISMRRDDRVKDELRSR
ncbi:MAG: hypothetical protein ACREN6_08720 [Gemmatimonadaceae bacterium]